MLWRRIWLLMRMDEGLELLNGVAWMARKGLVVVEMF